MISLKILAPYMDQKLSQMSQAEQFRYFVFFMHGAQYRLGNENLFCTDCSGTVCWPLFCMGLNIRMTAQDLFNRVFALEASFDHVREYWDHVSAVFYEHGGSITHVSPIVGRYAIFDAVNIHQPAQVKALQPVMAYYESEGYHIYLREIDWTKAQQVAKLESFSWDREADALLKELLE